MAKDRATAGFHTFVPTGCAFQHDGLRFRNHTSCLARPHRALFLGDSHTRGLYDVLLHRMKGNDEMALSSFKVANKASRVGNLHLEFLWDAFLDADIDCAYIRDFDSIVVSSGAHAACYRCPPTSEYVAHISRKLREWPAKVAHCKAQAHTAALLRAEEDGGDAGAAVQRDPPAPTTFIFVTSPAWYPQAVERFDCRTAQRLGRWNALVTKTALEAGWAVVDAGAISKPIQQDTRLADGVHYIRTDAIDPMVDELVQKLGICGNESA
ncbi:hypothetical protein JCM10450v2_004854 [Rhodotorula kratochvilovae]